MKKLLFIFLLFSASVNAQTLYKTVNGIRIEFTQAEYTQWRVDSVNNVLKIAEDSATVQRDRTVKNFILTQAQATVGVRYDNLTSAQIRLLFGILMFKEGAIDSAYKVKSLNTWVK